MKPKNCRRNEFPRNPHLVLRTFTNKNFFRTLKKEKKLFLKIQNGLRSNSHLLIFILFDFGTLFLGYL